MATDDWGQDITVYQNSESPNLEQLAKNLANGIIPRSVMRFTSASSRSAALTGTTAPVEGMVSWLQDTNLLYVYNGSAWVSLMQSSVLMDWTALGSLGAFASGFSASASPPPRMRKISVLGTEVWEYEGRIAIVSGTLTAATTKTVFTFSAGHRPANGRLFAGHNSSHYATRVTIASDGTLSMSVPSEAGNNVTNAWIDGIRITNPAA
ncbi:hypothetical protein ACFQ6Q_00870 [Streptomyces sp. NPDC056437]|uniref:hypothetical protein n=1 Tax=Streptomyces sp. NPDC056437 TaxID=3345816 RepID=UPI0036A00B71